MIRASAQAGKGRHQQKRTPLAIRGINHALDFVWGRNVTAYFKRTPITRTPLDRNIASNMHILGGPQQ
jgi:hypothetical protein